MSGKRSGRRSATPKAKRTREVRVAADRLGKGKATSRARRPMGDREIEASSPGELAELPDDFWDGAEVMAPVAKEPISLRVDADVLAWFRRQGPRYQSRMNAVLRSYMEHHRGE
jgi:uncharacterized protein (DUF4415 family)